MPKARDKSLPTKKLLTRGARTIQSVKMRQQCLELRAQGVSVRKVAEKLKISHQAVCKHIEHEMGIVLAGMMELGEKVLALQNERLDYIQDQMIQQLNGEKGPAAAHACITAMREQQRLFKLDLTPVRKDEGEDKPRGFSYVAATGEPVVVDER